MRKRILSWLLLMAMCLTYLPTTAFAVDVEDGLRILQGESIVMCEGGGSSVMAELYQGGSRVDFPEVTWEVEDPEVLLLTRQPEGNTQNLNFFALKEGDTTITAHSGGYEASVEVHVGPCINLSVDGESILTVQEGVNVTGGEGIVSISPSEHPNEYTIRGIAPGRTVLNLQYAEGGGTSYIDVYVDCYYVLWNAGDTVLADTVNKGAIPNYTGAEPTKAAWKLFGKLRRRATLSCRKSKHLVGQAGPTRERILVMQHIYTRETPVEAVVQQGSAARVVLREDMHIATLGELAAADVGQLHKHIIARGYSQKTAIETARRLGSILRDNDIKPRSFSWLSTC